MQTFMPGIVACFISVLSWYLGFLYFLRRRFEWQTAFLSTSIIWGVWLVAVMEALSLARLVRPIPLALAWCFLLVIWIIGIQTQQTMYGTHTKPYLEV